MDLFTLPDFDGHEQVVFGHDAATGLRAVVAIHSTVLGPAAGGCRMWTYGSADEA
ncbi:Glutamate/phenylalanine/leucine/valine dehydrogenase, dimerization region domain protein, partial [mine drainage metagenome]